MRVAFVMTYPLYHDVWSTEQWLALANRDRWMPGLLAAMGHDVEMWAGAREPGVHTSHLEGFGDYPVRLFQTQPRDPRTKFHQSEALVAYARQTVPDLYVLKGVDGGLGVQLLRHVIARQRTPFAFIIGGKYYTTWVRRADVVFYETEAQRKALAQPGLRFWRRPVAPERLIRLPKSVDTTVFRPMPGVEKTWDLISVGRLVRKNKNYEALGVLSNTLRVAVVGDGPEEAALRAKYPKVAWLGQVPNHGLPPLLNHARAFMHSSFRDFFPRVLAEAMACGLPCIAFAEAIAPDVLPPECGLRVSRATYKASIGALLAKEERLNEMARNSRKHAEATLGKYSARLPLQRMLEQVSRATRDREPADQKPTDG